MHPPRTVPRASGRRDPRRHLGQQIEGEDRRDGSDLKLDHGRVGGEKPGEEHPKRVAPASFLPKQKERTEECECGCLVSVGESGINVGRRRQAVREGDRAPPASGGSLARAPRP